MKKKISYLYIFLVVSLSVGTGYLLFANYQQDHPYVPEFFPLQNANARYKITKGCPEKVGWEEAPSPKVESQNLYCVEYRGDDVIALNGNENAKFYRIMVGNAKQNLEPFLNKEIVINSGRFVSSGKQCIESQCSSPQGSSVNLDLDSISLK